MQVIECTQTFDSSELSIYLGKEDIDIITDGGLVQTDCEKIDLPFTVTVEGESTINNQIHPIILDEIPSTSVSVKGAERRGAYDDVLKAMREFNGFFCSVRNRLDAGTDLSTAIRESFERNNVQQALYTYQKYESIQRRYE